MGKQVYVARSRVLQDEGIYRRAYLGEYSEPVIFGIMGAAKSYYGHESVEQEIPGTMDYLPAAVGA